MGEKSISRREIKSAPIQLRRGSFERSAGEMSGAGGVYTDCVPRRVPLSKVSGRVPTDCVRVEQSNPGNHRRALLSRSPHRRRRSLPHRPHRRARISRRRRGGRVILTARRSQGMSRRVHVKLTRRYSTSLNLQHLSTNFCSSR